MVLLYLMLCLVPNRNPCNPIIYCGIEFTHLNRDNPTASIYDHGKIQDWVCIFIVLLPLNINKELCHFSYCLM